MWCGRASKISQFFNKQTTEILLKVKQSLKFYLETKTAFKSSLAINFVKIHVCYANNFVKSSTNLQSLVISWHWFMTSQKLTKDWRWFQDDHHHLLHLNAPKICVVPELLRHLTSHHLEHGLRKEVGHPTLSQKFTGAIHKLVF